MKSGDVIKAERVKRLSCVHVMTSVQRECIAQVFILPVSTFQSLCLTGDPKHPAFFKRYRESLICKYDIMFLLET